MFVPGDPLQRMVAAALHVNRRARLLRQRGKLAGDTLALAADVMHDEAQRPVIGLGDVDLRDAMRLAKLWQFAPQMGQDTIDAGGGHRALLDINNVVTAATVETDNEPFTRLPAFELNTATVTPLVGGADRRLEQRRLDGGLPTQRLGKDLALPPQLLGIGQMLPLASAASPENGTGRFSTLRRRPEQFNRLRLGEVLLLPHHPDANPVPGGGKGDEDRLPVQPADAVAAEGERIDVDYCFAHSTLGMNRFFLRSSSIF